MVIEKHRVQKKPFLDFSNLETSSWCVGTMHLDFSKAFDYIRHILLIVKLEGYRLDKTALNILLDYSDPKKQCIKIGFAYSTSSAYNACSIFVNNLNCHFM